MHSIHTLLARLQRKGRCYYAGIESQMVRYSPIERNERTIFGFYFIAVGMVDWIAHRLMHAEASKIFHHWVLGLAAPTPTYNVSFVTYVIFVFSVIGAVLLYMFLRYLPRGKRLLMRVANCFSLPLFAFSFLAMLAASPPDAKMAFFAAFLLLFGVIADAIGSPQFTASRSSDAPLIRRPIVIPMLLLIPVLCALWVATKAWYPVVIPHEFLEIPDAVEISGSGVLPTRSVDRQAIIDCLAAQELKIEAIRKGTTIDNLLGKTIMARIDDPQSADPAISVIAADTITAMAPPLLPKCHEDITVSDLSKLEKPIMRSGAWQSGPGRLFYHHSFIYVPARHFLTYGLQSPIPYMYGVGNTLFHAMLMKVTSVSLSGYFETFPIAQLTGILAFGALTWYVTRKALMAPVCMALMLIMLFRLQFEYVLLPPGFSPLRYIGLFLQIAAIFICVRGNQWWRPIPLVATAAVSIFWNTEFGMIGLVGQFLVLLTPTLNYSMKKRVLLIATMLITTVLITLAVNYVSRGFLQTMHLGLLGLFPIIQKPLLLFVCTSVSVGIGLLARGTKLFEASERQARLSVLPILALLVMKFVFYPWLVHLYFSLAMIIPMALIYMNWERYWVKTIYWQRSIIWFASFAVLLCGLQSLLYYRNAAIFRQETSDPFVKHVWKELGEQFETGTAAEPIVSRMNAVRSQLRPNDTVIFLSPFDGLMSFYANPEHYCGHFELNLNPITDQFISDVVSCVESTPNALVVYDEALTSPCPTSWRSQYYNMPLCGVLQMVRQGALSIFNQLQPNMVLVHKSGPLSFYRHRHTLDSTPDDPKQTP